MCVDELNVLQSQAGYSFPDYVEVLTELDNKLFSLVTSTKTENIFLLPFIYMIYVSIHNAKNTVVPLDIRSNTAWAKVLAAIKQVNSEMSLMAKGAQYLNPPELNQVCLKLVSATVVNDYNFLDIQRPTHRNKRMIQLLRDVGFSLSNPRADFYSFIGLNGMAIMKEIITHLTEMDRFLLLDRDLIPR